MNENDIKNILTFNNNNNNNVSNYEKHFLLNFSEKIILKKFIFQNICMSPKKILLHIIPFSILNTCNTYVFE